ncbi:MAG: cysteine--tRNA ligase [Candidatus Omnitrophica bacterium]|nr:cysteine--tRNA ligase [Candidatus Omnitrophota bacterium]MBU4479151.1 cysteine--tRNA ligase [Candidatus Omnitrophota bacterium]MCG2702790.1 cysteine--tRNA ligase [Candidatus Omnitrophota bacterium]
MIKIYNSLTGKKEEFKPIRDGEVKMYVCGPTVYDVSHIGHLRAAFVFDVIRRYMEYKGFKVTFARNITDIDDKIINRARQELGGGTGELSQKVKEVAHKYTLLYEEDMEAFGIKKPDIQPKATEHISDMISMIRTLIDKGVAYESAGDVYFSVRKFPEYGRLSHQSIDQMMEGVRKAAEGEKKDPLDFALWKKAKEGEPFWPSPWGNGRPGWHIECSVMSTNYLGATFDIHGGGRDLIFPHHENEIAQAEAATGKPFARCWIHNGLLTVEKEKMAKSLGNFVTVKDILDKYHPDVLKIFFLQAHYSSSVDFSWEKMEEAKKAYERFSIFFYRANELIERYGDKEEGEEASAWRAVIELTHAQGFIGAMDDDFNTAGALARLFEIVSAGNCIIDDQKLNEAEKRALLELACERIRKFGNVLALFENEEPKPGKEMVKALMESLGYDGQQDFTGFIEALIEKRILLRKAKEFKKADNIRNKLLEAGVILEDKKDGTTGWRLK